MRSTLLGSAILVLSSTSFLIACVGDDIAQSTSPAAPTTTVASGERGGPCYANSTCNEGLSCEDGLVCVTSKQTLSGDGDGGLQCKNADAFTPPTFRAPAPKSASCTDSQIKELAAACFKNPESPTCKSVRAQHGTCASCAFGYASDPQWKPIILGEGAPIYNVAGCIELATGGSGCGAKYHAKTACLDHYCDACTFTDWVCHKDVSEGSSECKPYLLDQSCAKTLNNLPTQCFSGDGSDTSIGYQFIDMVTLACK